jgi:transposase InsO family protein
VPAKTTDNVAHLLIEEIIPRHSGIQILTSDNGGENCSNVMQEVCEELNIKHIKTSFYHPQGNAKIERFHFI